MRKAACVQMDAGADVSSNLKKSLRFAAQAVQQQVSLIAYPENFLWRGPSSKMQETAQVSADIVREFQVFCRRYRIACLLGSLIFPSKIPGKFFNTSVFISNRGRVLGAYQKNHLFDVSLPKVKVKESKHFLPGNRTVVIALSKELRAGLSICYDLRFPELYRKLSDQGANLLFVPANFTYETGRAHWETLLRARAIENQCFVLAPGQCGVHPDTGIKSYGHSMIIDPWGKVLATLKAEREGVLVGNLDFKIQRQIRSRFPVLQHRKIM